MSQGMLVALENTLNVLQGISSSSIFPVFTNFHLGEGSRIPLKVISLQKLSYILSEMLH